MNIKKEAADITVRFSPQEYCVVKTGDDYELCHLVDRSYKGKGPEAGLSVMHLDRDQVQLFAEAGFLLFHY